MAKNREATIKFRADASELQEQIKQTSSKVTVLKSGMKLLDAEMRNNGASVDLLEQKQANLAAQLEQSRAKTQALEGKLELARQLFGDNSAEVDKLATQLNNARAAEQRIEAQIKQTSAAIEAQQQAERSAESALSKLTSEISEQEAKVGQLASEYKSAVIEFGEASKEAKALESKLQAANSELKDSKAKMAQAEQAADALSNGLRDVGEDARESGVDLADMAGKATGLAAAVMGGASIADCMIEASDAASRLRATLGDTGYAAELFDEAMGSVYASGHGESLDDVAESASRVAQVLGKDITPEQLEACTSSALALRDTFDIDVSGSMKAAKVMMENFGMSAEAAYDLLAKGAQDGLNINDDMVDSFAEYSPYFAQIGLDANDMFNAFASGAEVSMYGVDKAGDAFKEFGIRVVDGSDTTKEAFKSIGLSADDYAQRIMAGGDTAKQATEEIIQGLLGIEDPVERNITGVSLFGTQWEDLGQDGAEAMLSLMGQAVDAQGTLEGIDDVRYSSIGDSISQIGRAFETGLLQPITDSIAPAISDFADFFTDNFDTLEPVIIGVGVAFGVLAAAMAISGVINGVTRAMALLNGTMLANPITLIVALIAGLVAALVYLYNSNEDVRNVINAAWDGIKSAVGFVVDWFTGTALPAIQGFIDGIAGFFQGLVDTVSGIWNGIKDLITTAVSTVVSDISSRLHFIQSIWNIIWNAVAGVVSLVWNGIKNTVSSVAESISSTVSRVFNGVKSTVSDIWNGIKEAIMTPINAARDAVKTAIDKIKGFFDFSFSWPHISLPHFSVNPPGWKIGDLLKGSIPSLGIQWYAKGGIMTQPTLFGGGEAGPEAVLPIERLQGFIDVAFERNNQSSLEIERVVRAIEQLDEGLGRKIADNAPDSYPGDRSFRAALRKAGVDV